MQWSIDSSVGRTSGLRSKGFLHPGSIPELAMRCCVSRKDTLHLFSTEQAAYPLWWASQIENVQTEFKKEWLALVWLYGREVFGLYALINELMQ